MIVVDASVLLDLLLGRLPDGVVDRLLGDEASLHAPHLVDVEVAQVLRRYAMAGELSEERAAEAFADLRDLRIDRYPHDWLISRVWALRHDLTAYDASYVALAEALDSPLLTRDGRMASAPGHHAAIELV